MISESSSNQPDWVSELAELAVSDDVSLEAIARLFGDLRRVLVIHPEQRRNLWRTIVSGSTDPVVAATAE